MTQVQETAPTTEPATATVEASALSRWYGNVVAVNDISFTLGPGVTGLLGPNGAGKSTILHMLSGLLKPSAGDLSVLGRPAWRNPEIYRDLGLVPEREASYGFLSGLEFVRLSARLHRLPDPDAAALTALEAVDLTDVMNREARGYSKGMNQRLKVAAAIVHQPRVLLLDEPFNGTDPRQRLRLMDLFRRMAADGRTIVFSRTSSRRWNGSPTTSSSSSRAGWRRPATSTDPAADDRQAALVHAAFERQPQARGLARGRDLGLRHELAGERLNARSSDFTSFCRLLPVLAKKAGVSLYEVAQTDESLESVFSYLVNR